MYQWRINQLEASRSFLETAGIREGWFVVNLIALKLTAELERYRKVLCSIILFNG